MNGREDFEKWVETAQCDWKESLECAESAWQHQQQRIDKLEKKIQEILLDFRMNEQQLSVATSALERMSVVGTKTAIQALDIIKKLKGE